jgi:hypothetical protein
MNWKDEEEFWAGKDLAGRGRNLLEDNLYIPIQSPEFFCLYFDPSTHAVPPKERMIETIIEKKIVLLKRKPLGSLLILLLRPRVRFKINLFSH